MAKSSRNPWTRANYLDWEVVLRLNTSTGGTTKLIPDSRLSDSAERVFEFGKKLVSDTYPFTIIDAVPCLYVQTSEKKGSKYGWDTSADGKRLYHGGFKTQV